MELFNSTVTASALWCAEECSLTKKEEKSLRSTQREMMRRFTAGKQRPMKIGSVGYIISLLAISYAFYESAGGIAVVFFIFLFIASHAIGQGAVIWVFLAEIFPNKIRTKGQSFGSGTHWILAAIITLVMPYFLGRFEPHFIFGFFALMMVLQLLFVIYVMPETKKKTLESISETFR